MANLNACISSSTITLNLKVLVAFEVWTASLVLSFELLLLWWSAIGVSSFSCIHGVLREKVFRYKDDWRPQSFWLSRWIAGADEAAVAAVVGLRTALATRIQWKVAQSLSWSSVCTKHFVTNSMNVKKYRYTPSWFKNIQFSSDRLLLLIIQCKALTLCIYKLHKLQRLGQIRPLRNTSSTLLHMQVTPNEV